ncbi:MAG: hypothetical protein LBH59_05315 [Planctomycetaceae bacterium]|nr:hypothetical protein [Planctomycetaceae bacterium]
MVNHSQHRKVIPKPVWAVGFALEQTLHVVTLAVFSYVDFKVASGILNVKFIFCNRKYFA